MSNNINHYITIMFTLTKNNCSIHIKLHKMAYKTDNVHILLWIYIKNNWSLYHNMTDVRITGGKHIKRQDIEYFTQYLKGKMCQYKIELHNTRIFKSLI
jgi:hypothetical protein